MAMTAKEAYAIASDAKQIKKFREKMDESISCAACRGKFTAQEYIPWKVSETAMEAIAEEYRDRGFAVEYQPREDEKNSYIDCGNYSERLVMIEWKDVKA